MSFASLKKNRKKNADQIKQALMDKGGSKRTEDERLWYPQTDEAGNGYAVIRFMPPAEGNNLPWSKLYKHGFKENGQWFIAECPTTIEKECPVCEANKELWQTEVPANRKIASSRKRKLSYYLNVYIVSDPKNPENEGKVKVFRCGTKIFEMLQGAQNPEFEDEVAVDPFDLWEGANFKLKIRKVEKQTNYDKSEFEAPTALLDGDDEKLEEVYKSLHDLREFAAESLFSNYNDLKARFNRVIGAKNVPNAPTSAEEMVADTNVEGSPETESVDTDSAGPIAEVSQPSEDEDALAMFKRLAED